MPRREEEYGLRADYAMNYAEAYIPSAYYTEYAILVVYRLLARGIESNE